MHVMIGAAGMDRKELQTSAEPSPCHVRPGKFLLPPPVFSLLLHCRMQADVHVIHVEWKVVLRQSSLSTGFCVPSCTKVTLRDHRRAMVTPCQAEALHSSTLHTHTDIDTLLKPLSECVKD